jgi:hypothetical protein
VNVVIVKFAGFELLSRPRRVCGLVLVAALALVGCREQVDPRLQALIDTNLPRAIELAEAVASRCPSMRQGGPPVAAGRELRSPALGSALAADADVLEVEVSCSWPVDASTKTGEVRFGTYFPGLRAAERLRSAADSTTVYSGAMGETVARPSVHGDTMDSLDIRVVRDTPDGGQIEVVVSVVKR